MKASYFYDRLKEYRNESVATGRWYQGYEHGKVTIHCKNNEKNYFTIYLSGRVVAQTIGVNNYIEGTIRDLRGDDYELYSPIQVVKAGYIEKTGIGYIEPIINELCFYIDSIRDARGTDIYGCMVKGQDKGFITQFTYNDLNVMEVSIQTPYALKCNNINRKYYGARTLPHDESIKFRKAMYVTLSTNLHIMPLREARLRANKSLEKLLYWLMNDIEVRCEYKDMGIGKPIYL